MDALSQLGMDGAAWNSPPRNPLALVEEAQRNWGMNNRELADVLGVSRQLVTQWKHGRRKVNGDYVPALRHLSEYNTHAISIGSMLAAGGLVLLLVKILSADGKR